MFLDAKSQLTIFNRRNYLIWFLLAFQAGAINVGGFLACHRFVTHTTGFATHFGVEFALKDYAGAFGMLTVPLFFLGGAMISGFLVDRRHQKSNPPNYPFVFFFISLLMTIVGLAGETGAFGEFGAPLDLVADYTLLALLSFSSGLQNAVITTASGAVVRTTHLTGITTDLGLGLVRTMGNSHRDHRHENEVRANWLRGGTIISFVVGSTICAFVFQSFNYDGFFIPAVISFGLGLFARHTIKKVGSQ